MQDTVTPTILIVDDAADTRQMLNETLKPHCTVLLAKNGEQALERARTKQLDLILLDVVMPGMSGFEVLSNLQADATTRTIPVIFLTGMDTDEDVERGLQYGAVDYIRKPFVREIVVARAMLHAHRSQQSRLLRQGILHSDAATALPNREALLEKLDIECRRAARVGSQFSVMLLELRHAELNLLTPQFDALLSAANKAIGTELADYVPWLARISRHGLAIVLPDVQVGSAGKDAFQRMSAIVALASQECGHSGSIRWRAAYSEGGMAQHEIATRLAALHAQLDVESWHSLLSHEG